MIRLTAVIEAENQAPRALLFESNARSILLGRGTDVDFQIPLATVSRYHAKIIELDGVYTLEDLGSTHGTQIAGKKLEEKQKRVLRNGDVIDLHQVKITVTLENQQLASQIEGESSGALANRAVQGILGRLAEGTAEGPYLRVLSGPFENQRFLLQAPLQEWTIGRSKDCECQLDDPNISRYHAKLRKNWSGFIIADMESKNGVLVNDRKISGEATLRDRDEITIGPVQLVFVDPDGHLLDALKDVPGFGATTVAGAHNLAAAGDESADWSEDAAAGNQEDDNEEAMNLALPPLEQVDLYENIDPKLLAPPVMMKRWREIALMATLAIFALVGASFVYFLF